MEKLQLPTNVGQGEAYATNTQTKYFDSGHGWEYIPLGLIFCDEFGALPCSIQVNKMYSEEAITFLRKKGKLLSDHISIPPSTPQTFIYDVFDPASLDENNSGDYKGAFIYKNMIVKFERVTSKKTNYKNLKDKNLKDRFLFNLTFLYKPNTEPAVSDFDKFLVDERLQNVIHTIFRDEHGGVAFEPFETHLPKNYSIKKYYNDDFAAVHARMINSLKQKESGLYLLHGEPGTGKTTYIKYISSIIQRDLIYIPISLIETLSDPSFMPILLKRKHCALVIEDAEKALLSRTPGEASSLVSAILNLTDGIMGDVFNISIIATYNSPRQDIDKALLRKGRLKCEYKFDKLSAEKAQVLLNEHKIKYKATEPMSLADIFNTDTPDPLTTKELTEEKRMGFC